MLGGIGETVLVTTSMITPTAPEAVGATDDLGAEEPRESAPERRRALTERAYRRLAVSILELDIASLAAEVLATLEVDSQLWELRGETSRVSHGQVARPSVG
jgi:hypothetical protein